MSDCVQWQNLFGESNFNDSFDSLLRQKSSGNSATNLIHTLKIAQISPMLFFSLLSGGLPWTWGSPPSNALFLIR